MNGYEILQTGHVCRVLDLWNARTCVFTGTRQQCEKWVVEHTIDWGEL